MKVCGVICEYNPFHKGHALHLERARKESGADYVVCAMSGSITQRGMFARFDKWTRAKMALSCGADLVLELPVRFSGAPAQEFAAGGAALLSALGVLTHLSFGCEKDALPLLSSAAGVLSDESPAFKEALRAGLQQGLPYPRARALAAQQMLNIDNLDTLIAQPNASLAIEYLRALPEHVTPVPIVREGCSYHEKALGELASATAIREAISRGSLDHALDSVPCPDLLKAAHDRSDMHEEEALTLALLCRLRTMSAGELAAIAGMEEGLEHRFLSAAKTARTRDDLILLAKSKRYTYARLSRICTHILLGVTKEYVQQNAVPTYARVLGFRRDARPLLRAIKEHSSVPLVTKAADYDRTDPLFALDVRAQDLWSLGCTSPALQSSGRDYITGPIIL